jgi:large subunit ribosomal protein L17
MWCRALALRHSFVVIPRSLPAQACASDRVSGFKGLFYKPLGNKLYLLTLSQRGICLFRLDVRGKQMPRFTRDDSSKAFSATCHGEESNMRHLKSGSKLGRNPWHRRATLRNLVTNLFEHGRITTTLTRAKAARPVAEKMITFGKRDTLQSRRQAAAYIMTPAVTKKLFSEIAPKFADRAGGYTRIISAGNRVGDGAKVAILELVGYEFKAKEKKAKEKTKKEEPVEAAS